MGAINLSRVKTETARYASCWWILETCGCTCRKLHKRTGCRRWPAAWIATNSPPHPPPLPSPPPPVSVLLINLLVVVSPSLSSTVLIRLQLYLEEVGSWRLTAKGFPLSPAVGQWNYEHSSQSLYRPVLKLFVFRTQRNFADHGDWSLRSLGFSPPPGKTDEMCARVWGIWGLFRWDWERSHALFILVFRLVSPGLPLCVNGANICVVKFVPGLEMAHDTSPAQPGPSVQVYSRLVLLARVWLSFRAPSLGQKISRVWQCARGSFTLAMPFTFCPEKEKTGEGEKLKMEEDWSRAQGVYPLSMCKSRHQLLSPVASIFRSATNLSVSLGLWGCECVSEKHTQEHGEEERREKRERQRGVSETQKEGQWTNLAALLCWVFLLKSTGLCRRGLPWDI